MSFARETSVTAVRKRHRCDGCGQPIEIGEPAQRWAGMNDGDFVSVIHHTDCRDAEIGLNDILGTHGPDEWVELIDIDSDDWSWLREAFPSVAFRMNIPTPADGAGA